MTLRRRLFVVYVSLLLVIQLGLSFAIYLIYSQYREEVFYDRLENRILLVTKLMFEVRDMDAQLTRAIDKSTIHSLYNEKVIVFDTANNVVYSSIDDAKLEYSNDILHEIREVGEWRKHDGNMETLGLHYNHKGTKYVALATAFDKHGIAMIDNLLRTLGISFVISLLLSVITGRFVITRTLKPVAELQQNMQNIGPSNLNERVREGDQNDELNRIAHTFNVMLERLETAFKQQQNFIHFASHEMNTPLAVTRALLEGLKDNARTTTDFQSGIDLLLKEEQRLTELLASLLMLSSLENVHVHQSHTTVRVDELLFEAAEECAMVLPDLRFEIEFGTSVQQEADIQASGIAPLLRTAFRNIIENGWKYSTDKTVSCLVEASTNNVQVTVSNHGELVAAGDETEIFRPFFRGGQGAKQDGQGLGLAIVDRIIQLHGGSITYRHDEHLGNVFTVTLPHT